MLQPPGDDTRPDLPLREEIRQLAAEAAQAAIVARREAQSETRKHTRLDQQAIVMVLLAIAGGIYWGARLEGRVDKVSDRAASIEQAVGRNDDQIARAQDPIIKRLDRIENKMDEIISGNGRRR